MCLTFWGGKKMTKTKLQLGRLVLVLHDNKGGLLLQSEYGIIYDPPRYLSLSHSCIEVGAGSVGGR